MFSTPGLAVRGARFCAVKPPRGGTQCLGCLAVWVGRMKIGWVQRTQQRLHLDVRHKPFAHHEAATKFLDSRSISPLPPIRIGSPVGTISTPPYLSLRPPRWEEYIIRLGNLWDAYHCQSRSTTNVRSKKVSLLHIFDCFRDLILVRPISQYACS